MIIQSLGLASGIFRSLTRLIVRSVAEFAEEIGQNDRYLPDEGALRTAYLYLRERNLIQAKLRI